MSSLSWTHGKNRKRRTGKDVGKMLYAFKINYENKHFLYDLVLFPRNN